MCGIAGIVDVISPPAKRDIDAMVATIPYRGPDGVDTICFDQDGVALGHRRLSIIDLSHAGDQPMASADGRYWMVYNGEIYNYLEIRRELEGLGWTFRSHSDTEVLLCAYQQWGADALRRCMGMFAFAIWDRTNRELFLARDRLGIKPLYYVERPNGLVFASEIKSILAVTSGPSEVDRSLIDAYMDFGYVPGADTMHKGVKRLLPGHILRWRDSTARTSSYWTLDFGTQSARSFEESAEMALKLLQESVALHLRSDVPLGVFLSGGLDSSAVVAFLAEGVSTGLKTFSVAYDFGPEYDETPYARQVAKAFHTDHHEIRVTPKQFADFIPDYIWYMDEPVTEAAAISLYYVAKLAREQVVVCLSGEGSDEVFAGYDFYKYNLAIEGLQGVFGTEIFGLLGRSLPAALRIKKVRKYLELASGRLDKRYRGISSYDRLSKRELYSSGFRELANSGNDRCREFLESLFSESKQWDPLSRMLHFDTKTWLVDDLLIKADRMSMANSIELRVPFLDHRVVEFGAALPASSKIRQGSTKAVLKKSLAGRLPEQVVNRKKMGFPTPIESMLRGELFEYARDTLLSQKARERGYFDSSAVERVLNQHRSGAVSAHREIWQLLVLEEWHRRFAY